MGGLILSAFAGVLWLTVTIVGTCIKATRSLGNSLIVGGGSIVAGYFIGSIIGWVIMALGVLIIIRGTWRKEEAKSMLKQDKIDDYERFHLVSKIITTHHSHNLSDRPDDEKLSNELKVLEWKSTLQETKEILRQGKIDIHNKKERERFSRISSKLDSRHRYDPEAKELWLRLQELKDSETINRKR
ncbi:MAG: hypothetical protein NTV30_07775 [Chloroflexi bacterium]|nr:hypothetical protein [Chloroflexota bacterium]